jgi:Ca2+-binding EF-hand superfamily protein
MRCCEVNRARGNDPEDIIYNLEVSLNFSKLPALDIDRLTHRFCTNLIISKAQFSTICKELKLESNTLTYEFLETFYDSSSCGYPVVLLSTLGTLLGSGTQNSKLILLFKNYDIDSSNMLEREEIRKMCDDVTCISFQYIVSFASRKSSEDIQHVLSDYKNQLMSIKNTMGQYFTNIIMQDRQHVSIEEFLDTFHRPELGAFLNPHNLRVSSKDLLKIVFRAAEAVNIMMSENVVVDKKLERKLSLRLTKHARKNNKIQRPNSVPVVMKPVKAQ